MCWAAARPAACTACWCATDIEVVARPGASLDEIEKLVDAEIGRLAAAPPTEAELAQARAVIETDLLQRMEKVGMLADLINHYNQMAGDPDFVGKDLARYRQAKVAAKPSATGPARCSATCWPPRASASR